MGPLSKVIPCLQCCTGCVKDSCSRRAPSWKPILHRNRHVYPVGTDADGCVLGELIDLDRDTLLDNLKVLDVWNQAHDIKSTIIVVGDAVTTLNLAGLGAPESHETGRQAPQFLDTQEVCFFSSYLTNENLKHLALGVLRSPGPSRKPGWFNNRVALSIKMECHDRATIASMAQNLLLYDGLGYLKVLAADWVFAFCWTGDRLTYQRDRLTMECLKQPLDREEPYAVYCLRRWVQDRNNGEPIPRQTITSWATYYGCQVGDSAIVQIARVYQFRYRANGITNSVGSRVPMFDGSVTAEDQLQEIIRRRRRYGNPYRMDCHRKIIGCSSVYLAPDGRIIQPTIYDTSSSSGGNSSINDLPWYRIPQEFRDRPDLRVNPIPFQACASLYGPAAAPVVQVGAEEEANSEDRLRDPRELCEAVLPVSRPDPSSKPMSVPQILRTPIPESLPTPSLESVPKQAKRDREKKARKQPTPTTSSQPIQPIHTDEDAKAAPHPISGSNRADSASSTVKSAWKRALCETQPSATLHQDKKVENGPVLEPEKRRLHDVSTARQPTNVEAVAEGRPVLTAKGKARPKSPTNSGFGQSPSNGHLNESSSFAPEALNVAKAPANGYSTPQPITTPKGQTSDTVSANPASHPITQGKIIILSTIRVKRPEDRKAPAVGWRQDSAPGMLRGSILGGKKLIVSSTHSCSSRGCSSHGCSPPGCSPRGSSPKGSSPLGGSPRGGSPKGWSSKGSSPRGPASQVWGSKGWGLQGGSAKGGSPRGGNLWSSIGRIPERRGRQGDKPPGSHLQGSSPRSSSRRSCSTPGSSPVGGSPRGSSPDLGPVRGRTRKQLGKYSVEELKMKHEMKIRQESLSASRDGY